MLRRDLTRKFLWISYSKRCLFPAALRGSPKFEPHVDRKIMLHMFDHFAPFVIFFPDHAMLNAGALYTRLDLKQLGVTYTAAMLFTKWNNVQPLRIKQWVGKAAQSWTILVSNLFWIGSGELRIRNDTLEHHVRRAHWGSPTAGGDV